MIDKNGKLFGKINVIDLLIIIVVVAALAVVGIRALGGAGNASGAQKVRLTFFGNAVPTMVGESLTRGAPVKQYSTDISLGVLTDFSCEPAYENHFDGISPEVQRVPVPNYSWVTIVCEPTGTFNEWGFTSGATTFTVGGNYWLDVGASRAGYMLKSIEPIV